jgi:hypothetical protein
MTAFTKARHMSLSWAIAISPLLCTKILVQVWGSVNCFVTFLCFYGEELLAPSPTTTLVGPPIIGCPWPFIQNIFSYPSYVGADFSMRNLRTRRTVVTGTELSWWQGPTYRGDRDRLIVVTRTDLSWWQGPTYRCDRDRLITEYNNNNYNNTSRPSLYILMQKAEVLNTCGLVR